MAASTGKATGTLTTHIVVEFSKDTDGNRLLIAEVDTRTDGYNDGKSSFVGGDTVYFLVFKTPNVGAITHEETAGTVIPNSAPDGKPVNGFIPMKEVVAFINEKTSSTKYPVKDNYLKSTKWLGKSGGTITVNGNKLSIASSTVAVALVEYDAAFTSWALVSPTTLAGEKSFTIIVVLMED